MNLILFDDPLLRVELFPFTMTRPTGNLRVGILTIDQKWSARLGTPCSFLTEAYLQHKFPLRAGSDNLLINGALCPDDELVQAIKQLGPGETLISGDIILASRTANAAWPVLPEARTISYGNAFLLISKPWKIFEANAGQIAADLPLITQGRRSQTISDPHTAIYGADNLFVEEGVSVRAAIINAERGPVYLGRNSVVHEGAVIRGSFALCEHGEVNVGAKIRGDTTIGPYCKVGGEVAAAVLYGYSNKSHDGYLGCSVIGEWCNIGADSNTSNLKNNYETVKLWSHATRDFQDTGLQFCGLMMGDHSKCAINTMFNTGTVVDVFANIFGEGFVRNYIPSFSWGGTHQLTTYKLEKALETMKRVMGRRNVQPQAEDIELLTRIYEQTAPQRSWESPATHLT
ncbi:MAG TPA: GlmU family protein [Cyclobacteriaceae bacterium]|jgi:UDP-N-acetylglucosamine diphosphorylase/glucosamine-1-phosphate N-acetyltransferase